MYNRILNRPMFKRGGATIDAQGSGITSGLDTPRQGYANTGLVQLQEDVNKQMAGLKVDPQDYRQAT
jgi:hypothetical protein